MKKVILLYCLLSAFILSAFGQGAETPVSMVSYEQRWLDSYATIALKNNTQKEITRVNFQLTYLDMNNNQMDYKEFEKSISIAPGMVKKLDITAYEHDRSYHYYKTRESLGNPTFKIRYKYLGHKNKRSVMAHSPVTKKEAAVKEESVENIETPISLEDTTALSAEQVPQYEKGTETEDLRFYSISDYFVYYWLPFSLIIAFYIIVALMAQRRNRNAISWVLLSIVITPVIAAFLLYLKGAKASINFYYRDTNPQ